MCRLPHGLIGSLSKPFFLSLIAELLVNIYQGAGEDYTPSAVGVCNLTFTAKPVVYSCEPEACCLIGAIEVERLAFLIEYGSHVACLLLDCVYVRPTQKAGANLLTPLLVLPP